MENILIVYGSTTGNTEEVANVLLKYLQEQGHKVKVENADSVSSENLAKDYSVVIFGCSTWGSDEIELQDDFIPLYDGMSEMGLSGKKIAVFGCGDSSYEFFCGAVDVIEKRAEENGGKIITGAYKIDGDPEKDDILSWAKSLNSAL